MIAVFGVGCRRLSVLGPPSVLVLGYESSRLRIAITGALCTFVIRPSGFFAVFAAQNDKSIAVAPDRRRLTTLTTDD
jgi:hypothetical protein